MIITDQIAEDMFGITAMSVNLEEEQIHIELFGENKHREFFVDLETDECTDRGSFVDDEAIKAHFVNLTSK